MFLVLVGFIERGEGKKVRGGVGEEGVGWGIAEIPPSFTNHHSRQLYQEES